MPQSKVFHTQRGQYNYGTPIELYTSLNKEFNFDLDPCADPDRILCRSNYIRDGLQKEWIGNIFVNPPFKDCGKWVEKAYESSVSGAVVVCLLPARTDTAWFHKYVLPHGEIRWIRGRIRYVNAKYNAPFSSMIVIFRSNQ